MRIGSDRRYDFDVSPDVFWAAAARTDMYQQWWPWLRRFDAGSLAEGEVWTCCVRPPLPYAVSFTVELHEVCQAVRVQARVTGDIQGHARLDIDPVTSGCRVRLRSHLAPSSRRLRTASLLARPVVGFGHNWVLDTGARQFRHQAF
ncbi:MAG TPA: hypothetical protein VG435_14550 [Acidimicrobiales bacterium]|nr:hypothetical protein [Acidimicrobiales bacterium]